MSTADALVDPLDDALVDPVDGALVETLRVRLLERVQTLPGTVNRPAATGRSSSALSLTRDGSERHFRVEAHSARRALGPASAFGTADGVPSLNE